MSDPEVQPVETPPEAPEQPAEQPDEAPESQALMEEIGKKLDSQTRANATRISNILGDEAPNFDTCPMCSYFNTPGFVYRGHLPQDLREHLAGLIGQRLPGHLQEDRHSHACPDCGGEGMVKTGSNVPGQDQLPCVECEGLGWMPTDDARRRGRLPLANGATQQALGVTDQDRAMSPTPTEKTPEQVALEQQGYTVIPPIVFSP